MSALSLTSQSRHWIDPRGTPGGDPTRTDRGSEQRACNGKKDSGIAWVHVEQHAIHERSGENCGSYTDQKSDERQRNSVRENHPQNRALLSSQRNADSNFLGPASDHERHHPIKTDDCQRKCQYSKSAAKEGGKAGGKKT